MKDQKRGQFAFLGAALNGRFALTWHFQQKKLKGYRLVSAKLVSAKNDPKLRSG